MRIPVQVLAGALLLLFLQHAEAQSRIATVDLKKVFNEYWKKKEAEKGFNAQAADLEKDARSMFESRKRAKEEAQALLEGANDQAVSLDEREKRRKAADEKLKQVRDLEDNLVQYDRQARATLDTERQRIRSRILGEITDVVSAKAKAGGFSLVLNTTSQLDASTGSADIPFVIYRDSQNDLTAVVLAELNATAPASLSHADQDSASVTNKAGSSTNMNRTAAADR
jgi:Skp family chaperone for outer membrane proteins